MDTINQLPGEENDPIVEADEEALRQRQAEINALDDLHEIQVDDDLGEPDPEKDNLNDQPDESGPADS